MPRELSDLWHHYADTGPGDDAPMYRAIAHMVADDDEMLAVVRATPTETHHPNHLLAAARFLMLGGLEHGLADAYAARDPDAAVTEFRAFVLEHRDALIDVLQTRRTQTNEVGRVAVIAPALAHLRRSVDRPLALIDVGTSAGLNLLVDRCNVTYPLFDTGNPGSPLQLDCAVDAAPPPFTMADLDVVWRVGLDRSPIAADDEVATRWLLACVWPDQRARMERLAAGLAMGRETPSEIVTGDAVDDLAPLLDRVPVDLHPVVLTSWVTFYLSRERRSEFDAVMRAVGRPVTWLSLEHPGVVPDVDLPEPTHGQRVAPSAIVAVHHGGGTGVEERRFLGWAHPHGRWLDWQAPDQLVGA